MISTKILLYFLMLMFLMVIGCGGSSSSSSSSSPTLIGLTDAQGDFLRYSVNVTALDLYKADGTVVHTLPLTTTVDFAQLTSMTEFLTANTVGVGTYTKVVMTLDYSSADIEVDDGSGNAVQVPTSNILDWNSNPITSPIAVTVNLDTSNLKITAGGTAHLVLDFDLGATNTVTFSGSTPSLYVTPILDASLTPDTNKDQRFRGLLQSVDMSGNSFVMILRPFDNDLSNNTQFGTKTVLVNSSTVYNINGTIYTGNTGLSSLNTLFGQQSTLGVIAYGTFDANLNFTATEVLTGTSVPGETKDVVRGTVLSVSGSAPNLTFTLKGATPHRGLGHISFRNKVTVSTGANTAVSKQYSNSTSLTVADIMPGQIIEVYGTLAFDEGNIDATSGFIRMDLTTISGTTNSNSTTVGQDFNVPMTLQRIGDRDIHRFASATPAIPSPYLVQGPTILLHGATIAENIPVIFKGFPLIYSASSPDFDAFTYIDLTNARAFLNVGWGFAGKSESVVFTPIPTSSSTSLTLDISTTGHFHNIYRGGVITELSKSSTLDIVTDGNAADRFRIEQGDIDTVYSSFSSFIIDLNTLCGQGANIQRLNGWGTYSDSTTTFTARHLEINLTNSTP
jgi:hypothetical protein